MSGWIPSPSGPKQPLPPKPSPPTFPQPPIHRVVNNNNVQLTVSRALKELNAMQDNVYVHESPMALVAGESVTLQVTFHGVTSVSAISAIVYHNQSNDSATHMPSGSTSVSGNVGILKALTALVGGEQYVIAITANCDGDTRVRKLIVNCVAASSP